ncbi:MAG TPA: glycosyltransferase family 2 protein [Ignavibacteriaceae bacterium]|nr:MAG: Chondroitin synthase [Ignavibacteria bacterium ADurb.Bin266]HQF42158.1 glycosyltransferase family 2 protein [Ignavibacteriaceae bacterium]HQI39711.1 glycosyltransferase family 2 protein [Ignavibacteriaceae bacterium]
MKPERTEKNHNPKKNICSVCIATFKRPALLNELIQSLFEQKNIEDIILEIVIVDNDSEKSAKEIVEKFSDTSSVKISYYTQPIQNISLTRNMALDKSTGQYLAILDDDETADKYWIRNLIDAIVKFDADAVFGYVIPVFDPTIPNWKRQREIYFEPIGNTGDTPLSFPTTNCMIKSDKVNQFNLRFNPEYGLSGGEDQVFFRLLSTYDAKFVVCREAITYETISANRSKLKSICKRATHQGNAYGRIAIGSADYSLHENTFIFLLKSILGIGHYGLQSLFFLPFKSKWIFSLIRLYLNIGKLSSVFQIKLLLYKSPSS